MPAPSARAGAAAAWNDAVARLQPTAFAFVMASGIISTALAIRDQQLLSRALLVVSLVGFAVLVLLVVLHIARHPGVALRVLQDPRAAFGHLTIVAALGVLASRLHLAGATWLAVPAAVATVVLWVVLSYGLPAVLMLRPHPEPVARSMDGGWLLWSVATQSVSVVLTTVDLGLGGAAPTIAIAVWGIGVVLYLMLTTLVLLRLLSVPNSPDTMTPSYWILAGATAISVLAAAQILDLPRRPPALLATESFVSGTAFVLWAVGTWWIPLLVVFGARRHGSGRRRPTYEAGLWSIVFPLGMYAVASMRIGETLDLGIVEDVGRVATVVAVVAWVAVFAGMLLAAWRSISTATPHPTREGDRNDP